MQWYVGGQCLWACCIRDRWTHSDQVGYSSDKDVFARLERVGEGKVDGVRLAVRQGEEGAVRVACGALVAALSAHIL